MESLTRYGLEFQFETEQNAFFKNARMLELDAFLGDIVRATASGATACSLFCRRQYNDIVDMEAAIVRQLQVRVVAAARGLLLALDLAAHLDAVAALASLAVANRYCRPTMSAQQAALYVVRGRHALLEHQLRTGRAFVANNTALDASQNVLLLSGPNFSGKSIYLQQNALIVVLAHIGSFVPADAAQISLTDRVFARIYSNGAPCCAGERR